MNFDCCTNDFEIRCSESIVTLKVGRTQGDCNSAKLHGGRHASRCPENLGFNVRIAMSRYTDIINLKSKSVRSLR